MTGKFLKFILLFLFFFTSVCLSQPSVKTGLDNIVDYQYLFNGKRVGIITNHTAFNSNNRHITDVFIDMPGVTVTTLFGPEHGIRGIEAAGSKIDNEIDPLSKIPIYSLYGKNLKPTSEMLEEVDILIFDIQDIGARFYTYISTMSLAMEAAAEKRIPFIVLDRPNPINGKNVEGNTLEPEFATFVGLHPIAVRHGMTVGELAKMFNEEGWLKNSIKADLTIIPMKFWKREMWYDQTGLKWRSPSPNIPDLNVATVYPGICLFEGTNLSEGRGTYEPFLRVGSPWYTPDQISAIIGIFNQPGITLELITFTPRSIPNMSPHPKHMNVSLKGLALTVTDRNQFEPYLSGIILLKHFYKMNPEQFKWRVKHFDRLCGTEKIREFIMDDKPVDEIQGWLAFKMKSFLAIRDKYLMYE